MNLSEYSMKRPVTVIVIMLIFLTIGIISFTQLPLELMPEISFPMLMVYASYPSSSPKEVERTITRPLEDILATLENLKTLSSTSDADSSRIFIEFDSKTNMDLASMEIREKIDQIRVNLPDDLERVYIRRWSTSDRPVIRFNFYVPGDAETNSFLAENIIKPKLERVEGVANVDIRGILEKQLRIDINPDYFYTSRVRLYDIIDTLNSNNVNISAGHIIDDEEKFLLRVKGELKEIDQLATLPINDQGLRIKDVATVTYDYPEKERYFWLNGQEALGFRVYKASDANVVEVCNQVRRVMGELQESEKDLSDMVIRFYRDSSEDIKDSIRSLVLSGVIGGIFAILVLLFFLRKIRSTLIISVAIPIAIVFTFSFIYLFREWVDSSITINIISLSGLMMAVGMLVDNSIVVLENIFRLRQEKGYSAFQAALEGSREVSVAVAASTLTTLVVFVSIGFISDSFFAKMMSNFALSISLALVASLIVALTFIPLAGSRLLVGRTRKKAAWLVWLTALYERIISFSIRNWKTKLVILSGAALVIFSAVYMLSHIEQSFMPPSEERELEITVMTPGNYSKENMVELYTTLNRIVEENKEAFAVDNYTCYFDVTRVRRGRFYGEVELNLLEEGPSVSEIKSRILELFPQKPGVKYEFGHMRHRGGFSGGISIELQGKDFAVLETLADRVIAQVQDIDIVEDISTDLEGGSTHLTVNINRQRAKNLGIDSRSIARTIQSSLSERPIGKFKTENKEIDIILRLRKRSGLDQEDIKNLNIMTENRDRIPLAAISEFNFEEGTSAIQKENKKSRLRIDINTTTQGMKEISQVVSEKMKQIEFPPGYSWSFGKSFRRFRESQESSNMAIILALVFIYIIMASLFESFIHPFTILLTVPLAIFGVALFFTVFGITMNTTSMLGLLTLFGIVVNNGIILIDHIKNLRLKGLDKNEAIVQAGKDRMRPIIMTAITTIFGILPMALPVMLPGVFTGLSRRAQMWAPISVAIVGGLSTSTFFTLIFMPTLYSIFDSLGTRVKGIFVKES